MLTFALPGCQSEKPATDGVLKFNLQKGKSYDYEIGWATELRSQGKATTTTIGAFFSITVEDVRDGIQTMSVHCKRLKMNVNSDGEVINDLDSDKPASVNGSETELETFVAKVFSGIIGKPFTLKVDGLGNVVELSGFGKNIDREIESMNLDPDIKTLVEMSMKGEFSDNSIRDMFLHAFNVFPAKKINEGDVWEKSFSTSGKIPSEYSAVYTVKSIRNGQSVIGVKSQIGPANSGMNISGSEEGNLTIDEKTGLILNAEFEQNSGISFGEENVDITIKRMIRGKTG
jgi:hypothetical protein